MSAHKSNGRPGVPGPAIARVESAILLRVARGFSTLETPRSDPWRPRELPFRLWRVRAAVCRRLEAIEERAL
jgi:hypothetical protein